MFLDWHGFFSDLSWLVIDICAVIIGVHIYTLLAKQEEENE